MASLLSGITPSLRVAVVGMALAMLILGIVYVTSNRREREVEVTAESPGQAGIPPMDASAPTETETATFALG